MVWETNDTNDTGTNDTGTNGTGTNDAGTNDTGTNDTGTIGNQREPIAKKQQIHWFYNVLRTLDTKV